VRQLTRDSIYFYLFVVICLLLTGALPRLGVAQGQTAKVIVFEGARLITGDGSAPIENSAFIVENNQFTRVGRRGQLQIPAGAVHVDLTGKTVMPTLVDLHGHFGFQNVAAGTMSKDFFTRENLIDHLQRLAYNGVGAAVGIGDLVDRSDLHGGRTNWGTVPLQVRDEIVPGAAQFKTAGTGIAWPGSGPQGDPSRISVPYPVTTVEEARAAVRDNILIKPEFIKIWVDSRGGTKKTLTPELYRAVADEAHKHNVPVAVHNVTLADAKELMRAGVEAWVHVPVRGGEAVDDELIAIVKDRIARKDHPNMWITPDLGWTWMGTKTVEQATFLDDPLLRDTYSPQQIEEYWRTPLRKMTAEELKHNREDFELQGRNALKLQAAGMKLVAGTDTGQIRFLIGYTSHMDLESLVAIGMTPSQAIVAATRDSGEIGHFNTGLVAPGKSADFIVLDANPLESISNTRRINKVFLRGQEVDRAALKAKWQAAFRNKTN
jgi:imidazolonepropionase-like amidohydrolase